MGDQNNSSKNLPQNKQGNETQDLDLNAINQAIDTNMQAPGQLDVNTATANTGNETQADNGNQENPGQDKESENPNFIEQDLEGDPDDESYNDLEYSTLANTDDYVKEETEEREVAQKRKPRFSVKTKKNVSNIKNNYYLEIEQDIKESLENHKKKKKEVIENDLTESKKNNISFLRRVMPTQTIIFSVIIAIALIGAGTISTVIPLTGKKQAIIRTLKSLGVDVKINGNVYFNPFLMSFEIRQIEAVGRIISNKSYDYKPSVTLRTNNLKFNPFTRSIDTSSSQILVKTNDNIGKLNELISSLVSYKSLSKINISNSTLSVSPCYKEEEDNSNNKALTMVPLKNMVISVDNKKIEFDSSFELEGEKISLYYLHKGDMDNSFSLSSSFANIDFAYKIKNAKGPLDKVGTYSANILNSITFAKVLGSSRSSPYFPLVLYFTFRTNGDISFKPEDGLIVNETINTSYGKGKVTATFPMSEDPFDVNLYFDQINIADLEKNNNTSDDTSSQYLGIPTMISEYFTSKDHNFSIKIDHLITENTQSQFKFGYGVYKSMLNLSQSFLHIKNSSFEIESSANEIPISGKNNIPTGKNNLNNMKDSLKTQKHSVYNSNSLVPIKVHGNNLCSFTNLIRMAMFGLYNSPEKEKPEPSCQNLYFDGSVKFFLDNSNGNYGLKEIKISTNEGGLISGNYLVEKKMLNNILGPSRWLNLKMSGLELSGILPSSLILSPLSLFKLDIGNSIIFAYSNRVSRDASYYSNILLENAEYRGRKIEKMNCKMEKNNNILAVHELSGKSEIFKGNLNAMFDITQIKQPSLNIVADVDFIDIDAILPEASQSIDSNKKAGQSNISDNESNKLQKNDETAVIPDISQKIKDIDDIDEVNSESLLKVKEETDTLELNKETDIKTTDLKKSSINIDQNKQFTSNIEQKTNININDKEEKGVIKKNHSHNLLDNTSDQTSNNKEDIINIDNTSNSLSTKDADHTIPEQDLSDNNQNINDEKDSEVNDKTSTESKKKPLTDPSQPKEMYGYYTDQDDILQEEQSDNSFTGKSYLYKLSHSKKQVPYIEGLLGGVKIDVRNMILMNTNIYNLEVEGDISNSYVRISNLSWAEKEGRIEIKGKMNFIEGFKVSLRAVGIKFSINRIIRLLFYKSQINGNMNFGINLETFGKTYKEIVRNLNGKISFIGKNISIERPNIKMISDILLEKGYNKTANIYKILNQPGQTEFLTTSGKLDIRNGTIKTDEVIFKSVGYSGVLRCFADIAEDKIKICKSTFTLLGLKPWAKNGENVNKRNKFLKIPFSYALIGPISNTTQAMGTARIVEYFNALDQYDTVQNNAPAQETLEES